MFILISLKTEITKSLGGLKITRVPRKRRYDGPVPRAENVGDLITENQKNLSENCESRINHRYAVVVQDLTTQSIQSYPCKTKTFQKIQRSMQKFLESNRKLEVVCIHNSLKFIKGCQDFSWNHCTSTPHRSETHGIAERSAQCERRHICRIVAIRSG